MWGRKRDGARRSALSLATQVVVWETAGMTRFSLPFAALLAACSASEAQVESVPETGTTVADVESDAQGPLPVPTEFMPEPAMLIYSDTRGWRHEEGIAGGNLALIELAAEAGLGYYTTQHSEVFNPDTLARFDVIVMNSATGDSLSPAEKAAFEAWLANDGALVLVHGSLDASQKAWGFYQDELVGTAFISHPFDPQFQDADVVALSPDHPVMEELPARFSANDEWYTFDRVPDARFTILAGLDESTYSPRNDVYGVADLRMGPEPSDHPIVWSRCLPEGGRVVASALGHTAESFEAEEHRRLLANAIAWTRKAGEDGVGCKS